MSSFIDPLAITADERFNNRSQAEAYARVEQFKQILDRVRKGEAFPPDTPWSDPWFHKYLAKHLQRAAQWKRDSETLQAIRETFNNTTVSVFVGAKP